MADRVLIVESNPEDMQALYRVVRSGGFEASVASGGEEALRLTAGTDFALMLLAIDLEGMNGFEVIEALRARGSELPIIVVSGRCADHDALYGLGIGADDYVTKPFNPVTLGAKIKALIRRSRIGSGRRQEELSAGPFRFDLTTMRFYKNGTEIPLTGRESAMMSLFMGSVNRVFSKDMLYDLVWGNNIVDDNAVMVYISRLRRKIEDDPEMPRYIQNVRGIGYRFRA